MSSAPASPGAPSARSTSSPIDRSTFALDRRGESRAEILEAKLDLALEVVLGRLRRLRLRGRRSLGRVGLDVGLDGRRRLDAVDRDLEDALGLVDPAQLPLAEREDRDALGHSRAEQAARRLGDEDLAAAPDGAQARGTNDVEADVALLVDRRLAGVEAHAHANGLSLRPGRGHMRALHLDSGGDRVAGAREDEEERVALRVDLDALACGERVANDPAMRRQNLGVPVAEALEKLRRALDVREDEGDRSLRQLGHGTMVIPYQSAGRTTEYLAQAKSLFRASSSRRSSTRRDSNGAPAPSVTGAM